LLFIEVKSLNSLASIVIWIYGGNNRRSAEEPHLIQYSQLYTFTNHGPIAQSDYKNSVH